MRPSDRTANESAAFRPAVSADDNNGAEALPCIEIGGVQVYAYVRDGILVVSLDYDTAETSLVSSPFAVYDGMSVPTVVYAGGQQGPIWEAFPDDAIGTGDARTLSKAGELRRSDWVIPAWVYGDRS